MTDWSMAGTLNASPGIVGGMRTPRQRLEGSSLAASAGVSSAPYPWLAAANSPPVRSQGVAPIPDAIGTHVWSVVPSDVTVFPLPTRWLWIGGTGDVAVVMNDGTQFVFVGVPGGTRLPISVKQVLGTNTTATSIVGVY